jgi:hypothetical protein
MLQRERRDDNTRYLTVLVFQGCNKGVTRVLWRGKEVDGSRYNLYRRVSRVGGISRVSRVSWFRSVSRISRVRRV